MERIMILIDDIKTLIPDQKYIEMMECMKIIHNELNQNDEEPDQYVPDQAGFNVGELIEILQTSPGNFEPSWIHELRDFNSNPTYRKITRIEEIENLIDTRVEYYAVGKLPVPKDVMEVHFPDQKNIKWSALIDKLPSSVEVLHLGHDGVIGLDEDKSVMIDVLRQLPKLKKISYCGYHSQFTADDFREALVELGRDPSAVVFREIL
jgi:hypothetical protein